MANWVEISYLVYPILSHSKISCIGDIVIRNERKSPTVDYVLCDCLIGSQAIYTCCIFIFGMLDINGSHDPTFGNISMNLSTKDFFIHNTTNELRDKSVVKIVFKAL